MADTLYPTFSGPTVLTANWTLTLPESFQGRLSDGLLCLWHEDLTIWVNAMGTEDGSTIAERMARDRAGAGPDAMHLSESLDGGLGRVSYQLRETGPDGRHRYSLYTYTNAATAQVMIAFYFAAEDGAAGARAIYDTLQFTGG